MSNNTRKNVGKQSERSRRRKEWKERGLVAEKGEVGGVNCCAGAANIVATLRGMR